FGQSLCSFSVTPTTFNIGNQTFTGSISVAPASSSFCTAWSAAVDPGVNWLHIAAGASGNGPGTVDFTADANPAGTDRRATMTVAVTQILVIQSAKSCTFSVSPATASFAVIGGGGSVQVTANCFWQAASTDGSWILIPPNTNSNTTGTVNYTIGPNACVAGRSGAIVIQTGLANPPSVAIKQDGAAANLTISASSVTVDSGVSDGRLLVSTGLGCGWTAASDVSWIQITAGSSGSGNAGVAYHVLANTVATRTGNIHVTPVGTVGGLLLTVTQPASGPPVPAVTSVANAASYSSTAVSPGEIVSIFGSNLGPASPVLYQLNGGAFPTLIAGTQVLFDGTPAAMIYTVRGQVNAVAPYGLAGKTTTNVQVQYQGVKSAAVAVPVQAATPGVFSLDASGLGPGAILNQDFSINSGPNPAAKGSVVAIYCTGGGVTNPGSTDGAITEVSITGPPLPLLSQNVSVTIGGIAAKVLYGGGAPEAIAGFTQINVEVPAGVTAGSSVPVLVQVGTSPSRAGVTMAVK
ncbi:MAG TPA: BACON domain-containing carbohydrate-binding protein, partial [Candidatus Solibacter sp.]|nr:BACON domain-containing carbohydrate-binding protein [Candidatus Solibacter sp.]